MNAGYWTTAVTIHLPDSNRPLTVNSASEAAAVLADKWPITYGHRYQRALSACAAVVERHLAEDHSRLAFMEAAEEAGVPTKNGETEAITVPHRKSLTSNPPDTSSETMSEWDPAAIGTRLTLSTFHSQT